MAVVTQDPSAASWTPLNIWATLRHLANNFALVVDNAGAPVNGVSGTYAGQSGPGAILIDTTNANIYVNTNTLASPTWTRIGGASGAVLASPVISGTVTGTYTLGGSVTITNPVINAPVISTLKSNISTATVSAAYAADTYLAGSNITGPSGGFILGTRFLCTFDMVKTAAGTAAFTVTLRIGINGSIADAAILTFAFGAGTAAVDTGTFEVFAHFRAVGSPAAAVMAGTCYCAHALAATGLISTGASGSGQITAVSAGFDSTVANSIIGVSVNGGAAFSGTNTVVETELHGF